MFQSSTIIRELALNRAKVMFMLKHLVKLRRYLLRGCVAACWLFVSKLYLYQNASYNKKNKLYSLENFD